MSPVTRDGGRPLVVYVTALVAGVLFALPVGWALYGTAVPTWVAGVFWALLSAYLSRKRLPSEAVGSALQVGAVLAVFAPLAPHLRAAMTGADVTALSVAQDLFGPALVLFVVAAVAYVAGLFLKRRARRKLTKRARKGVYQSG